MTSAHGVPAELRAVPFRGLRFHGGADVVVARTFEPPDSWASFDALGDAGLDAHHLLRLLKPVFGAGGGPAHSAEVAVALDDWISSGVLVRDPRPAMYVYRRTDPGHVLVGVVAAVALRPENGSMLPHEQVIEQLVDAQWQLETATSAQLEPIVAVCTGATPVTAAVSEVLAQPPAVELRDGSADHEVWVVEDEATHAAVQQAMASGPVVVADGHHRFAAWTRAATRGGPWAYGLAMVLDRTSVRLGPVHRVVADLALDDALAGWTGGLTWLEDLDAVEVFLHAGPESRCVVASVGRYAGLDVGECAACWVEVDWREHHAATPVDYVHRADAALSLAADRSGVAILLATPAFDTVVDAAVSRDRLPHKASSFGPKPRVGLVMRCWAASGSAR